MYESGGRRISSWSALYLLKNVEDNLYFRRLSIMKPKHKSKGKKEEKRMLWFSAWSMSSKLQKLIITIRHIVHRHKRVWHQLLWCKSCGEPFPCVRRNATVTSHQKSSLLYIKGTTKDTPRTSYMTDATGNGLQFNRSQGGHSLLIKCSYSSGSTTCVHIKNM